MKPQLSLRDLFWLLLVVAMGCAWWVDKSQQSWLGTPRLRHTGAELDIGIVGRGYLRVTNATSEQTLYTRRGNLSLNPSGQLCLVRPDGEWLVEPVVTISDDASTIEISTEGFVRMHFLKDEAIEVGQLQLETFMNPSALREVHDGLYATTEACSDPIVKSPGENGAGSIRQYWLEKF